MKITVDLLDKAVHVFPTKSRFYAIAEINVFTAIDKIFVKTSNEFHTGFRYKLKEGMNNIRNFLEIDPNNVYALLVLAQLETACGRLGKGQEYAERALSIDSDWKLLKFYSSDLQKASVKEFF